MKSILIASLLLMSAMAQAATHPAEDGRVYNFKFRMQGEIYEYSQSSSSYEDAYEKAAKACYRHFKGGRRISEDRGLDIIDVCANPRTS